MCSKRVYGELEGSRDYFSVLRANYLPLSLLQACPSV